MLKSKMMMNNHTSISKKDLYISLLLAIVLFGLNLLPVMLPLPQDWRFTAAFFALQIVFVAPLLYYASKLLQRGGKRLFAGEPSMEGLAFAAAMTGVSASVIAGVYAIQGKAQADGLLFAASAVLLFCLLTAEYLKTQGLSAGEQSLYSDKTAAFVLPAAFALALILALSSWFYGLGAGNAWLILGSVLIAAGSGSYLLGDTLPGYFIRKNSIHNGYKFKNNLSAESCHKITLAVFDENFIKTDGQEITDVITASVSEAQLLALAASITSAAGHPLAAMFKNAAAGLPLPLCSGVIKMRGGMAARCGKKNIRMGMLNFVMTVAEPDLDFIKKEQELHKEGKSVYYITSGRKMLGLIAVAPKVASDLQPVLHALQKLDVRAVLLSSKDKREAEYTGKKAGFARTVSGLSAANQQELAETFCRAGEYVAVIKNTAESKIVNAELYASSGRADGGLEIINGDINNLVRAMKLSAAMQKIRCINSRITLWLSILWFIFICLWLIIFKVPLHGFVIASMAILSAAAVWLNSIRLRK